MAVMNVPGTSVGASSRPDGAARGFVATGAVFGILTRTDALTLLHPHADDDLGLGDDEGERVEGGRVALDVGVLVGTQLPFLHTHVMSALHASAHE